MTTVLSAPARLLGRFRGPVVKWGRSLLVRVVVVTLVFSALAILLIGWLLQRQITDRLLDAKLQAATSEVTRAAQLVQAQLTGTDPDPNSVRQQVARTANELSNPSTASSGRGASGFEPVIIFGNESYGQVADISPDLQRSVSQRSMVAWQYATIYRAPTPGTDGGPLTAQAALIIGSPANTVTDRFAVYLIFPMGFEQSTIAVVQNTLLLGGAALAVVLAAIAGFVAAAVVRPVRRAAAVAGRLAAGDLGERMPVKGPGELTVLASSFNGMADAIRAQIRQLEEFGKLQRRFTSDVSHELRTPVTTVRMAADLLHDSREELPEHLGRATELLVDELDRFESLLADLLEISRHDAGMAELAAETIDARAVVESVVTAAEGLARNAGVALRCTVPPEPVLADIDNRRVERILRNLINNAIDHAEGLPVEIELAGDEHAIAVTVTDHGVGLKPGEAGLVFNRFWRADPSRQRQTGGTGLGLAISLEDARLHGGWLQAWGHPGAGARFRLTLPRAMGTLIESSPLPLGTDPADEAPVAAGSTPAPDPHGLFDTSGPIARTAGLEVKK